MTPYTVHSLESAPPASQPLLQASQRAWGFIPTLHGILAEAPIALEAYGSLFNLVARSSLDGQEQRVVYITVSAFHGCAYCVAGHTYLGRQAELPEDAIAALRDGSPVPQPRWQALRVFTEAVLRSRGHAGDAALDAFLAAGYTKAQVLEVVTVIATKTISNYTNHLTHTPLEGFMADPALAWTPPV